jgi:hypothetical protein
MKADSSNDAENCTPLVPNKRRHSDTNPGSKHKSDKPKRYKQKYVATWENDHSWLVKSKIDDFHFFCKVCQKDYIGGLSEIQRHQTCNKHEKNCMSLKNQKSILTVLTHNDVNSKTKIAEMRIAAFVTEHNLPFAICDHLSNLIKKIGTDSKVVENISCGRTKCTGIVNNVIGRISHEELVDLMRTNYFSLLIDESTDKGCTKHLALVVRIQIKKEIKDCFFTLLPMVDSTANAIFNLIVDAFNKENIPYKINLIGFAADGANVMMGNKNSVSTLLKKQIPHIFILKCVCHSFALCASYACNTLPDYVEILVRDIYKYFQYSPKKFGEYKEFQNFCDTKPHKLLHPCQTRWLSLVAVVKRILEQWNALKLFFTSEVNEDNKLESAVAIYNKMQNVFSKLYLLFLDYILPYITDLNREMQSEKPKIYTLYSRVESVLTTILDMFIRKHYLEKNSVYEIDHWDPYILLPLNEVYLGGTVTEYIKTHKDIPEQELDKFKLSCLKFYQELVDQIKKRISFDNYALKEMSALIPKNVVNKKIPSIIPLALQFPNVISKNELNDIDREWRLIPNCDININIDSKNSISFTKFWDQVTRMENNLEQPMFPLVIKLVNFISILPHSSACVERIFSSINLNKTKTRNKLSTRTLKGILRTKRKIGDDCCYNFNVDTNMLRNMETKIIYDHKKEEGENVEN